jgi:hypothetical protein
VFEHWHWRTNPDTINLPHRPTFQKIYGTSMVNNQFQNERKWLTTSVSINAGQLEHRY